jgi:phosphoribosylaminoimidazole carboxylase PurE protein
MSKPWVCIVMGSDSDAEVMSQACAALDELGVPYQMSVASAHRSPERTHQIVTEGERDGAVVFIAGAGMAAHLPGVVASLTTRPVIGVPLSGSALQGVDALYAVVQMPPGHSGRVGRHRWREKRRNSGGADHRHVRRDGLVAFEGKSHGDGCGSREQVEARGEIDTLR